MTEVVSVGPSSERRLAVWYVGLDVHARESSYCILDDSGKEIKRRRVLGSPAMVIAELAEVKDRFAVCFEASDSYGYVYDRLRKVAARVAVGHPGAMRLIFRSKRKNDRVDAHKLATLLYLDEVPEVWVPSADVRSWRRLIHHRCHLMVRRGAVKNRVRALLRGLGMVAPKGLWTKRGLGWLRELALEDDMDRVQRDQALVELEGLQEMIKGATKVLDKLAGSHPGVALLRTIQGVGPRTAEAVVAYVDDPRRFKRNKAVGSYFGLVPCQDSSGGKERLGHITKDGPAVVRRLLNQAAWRAVRHNRRARAFYERVKRGKPGRKKIAIVATMHYLVRAMHAMLRTGEAWRDLAG